MMKERPMLLNKTRAIQIMEKNDLDALVASTPENVAYLTGFWILTSIRHRARQVYAVLTKKDLKPRINKAITEFKDVFKPTAKKA